jgi:hypothetical protein
MRTVPADPPQELIDRLKALPRLSILDQTAGGKLPKPLGLDWADDGAAEVYLEFSKRMDAVQEEGNDNRRDLSQRVCENSIRIANNIAIGRGACAVWKPDIQFGIQLMEQSFEAVTGGVERYMFERFEFPRMCEAVFNKIRSVGGKMKDRDLYRAFRNHQAWGNELYRACRYLETEGRITAVANLGTGNRKSPGWVVVEDLG